MMKNPKTEPKQSSSVILHDSHVSSSSSSSSSSSKNEDTTKFWYTQSCIDSLNENDIQRIPIDYVKRIQEKPYRGGFEPTVDNDQPYTPKITYGALPKDVKGTLASIGPGRIRIGNRQYGHWFDGDGYITLLSLDGTKNSVTFHSKYVQSKRYILQEKSMKKKRDSSSTHANNDDRLQPLAFSGAWTLGGKYGKWYENLFRFPTNPANTATMWLPPREGGTRGTSNTTPRLFALCEGGHPIEINPMTLDVISDEQPFTTRNTNTNNNILGFPWGGNVNSFFSAHFKRWKDHTNDDDGNTNEEKQKQSIIYNHGYVIRPSPLLPKVINLMKLSNDGTLLQQKQSSLPFDTFVHDSAISENHFIFILPPFSIPNNFFVLFKMLLGIQPLGTMFEWNFNNNNSNDSSHNNQSESDNACFVQIYSKKDLNLQWQIQLPRNATTSFYHFVDAYEEKQKVNDNDDDTSILKVRIAEHVPITDRPKLEKHFQDQYRVDETRVYCLLKEYTFELLQNATTTSNKGKLINIKNVAENCAPCEYPALNSNYFNTKDATTNNNDDDNTQRKKTRRNRYCWTNAGSTTDIEWLDGIQKVDMELGVASNVKTFGDGNYAGPPTFIPKCKMINNVSKQEEDDNMIAEKEDDGYIVTTIYKSDKHLSDIVLLDARTLEIICVMELKSHVPYQFHGDFIANYYPY